MKEGSHYGGKRTLPETVRLLNENLRVRGGLCFPLIVGQGGPWHPRTMQAVATAVGCTWELDGTMLLLKMSYADGRTCTIQAG